MTDHPPCAISFSRGQEAFQLFYERLLVLQDKHDSPITVYDDIFFRENQFHLTTMINTFNRHYCTGIGTVNTFYDIVGEITPVFMNLNLYVEPEHNVHRLLGVHLSCMDKENLHRDKVYFYFDNPAYDPDPNKQDKSLEKALRSSVFRLSIRKFKRKYYRSNIYHTVRHNIDALNLEYDEENHNFRYKNGPEIALLNKGSSSLYIECMGPPLFGHLYINGPAIDGYALCSDPHGLHNVQQWQRTMNPFKMFSQQPLFWKVPLKYIAHNRYVSLEEPVSFDVNMGIISSEDYAIMRILKFLFGLENIIYLYDNFKHLEYNPRVGLLQRKGDHSFITNEKLENGNNIKKLLDLSGYFSPIDERRKKLIFDIEDIDVNKNDAMSYVLQYNQINNYMNCIVFGTFAIENLLLTNRNLEPMEKIMDDVKEVIGWIPKPLPISSRGEQASSIDVINPMIGARNLKLIAYTSDTIDVTRKIEKINTSLL